MILAVEDTSISSSITNETLRICCIVNVGCQLSIGRSVILLYEKTEPIQCGSIRNSIEAFFISFQEIWNEFTADVANAIAVLVGVGRNKSGLIIAIGKLATSAGSITLQCAIGIYLAVRRERNGLSINSTSKILIPTYLALVTIHSIAEFTRG